MKSLFSKIIAAAAAVSMSAALFSCGGEGSSSESKEKDPNALVEDIGDDVNVSADDMPYGANITTLSKQDDGVLATTEFDTRYISIDEGKLFSNYFCSIAEKDSALFESVSYKPYLDAMVAESGCADIQDYVNSCYERYKALVGADFKFTYVYSADCKDANSGYNFIPYDEKIKELAPDAEIRTKMALPIYLNFSATDDSGLGGEVIPRTSYDFPLGVELGDTDFIWICIYNIDGKDYIIW